MVEMLIVVAVLGILAAALLATIDPFEQMKKARDTTLRNAVVDVFDAVTRYYGTQGVMPWEDIGGGVPKVDGCIVDQTGKPLNDPDVEPCIDELMAVGELKANFSDQLGDNASKIIIGLADATAPVSVMVCFAPDSKATRSELNTNYQLGDDGSIQEETGDECPDPSSNDCYWCLQ